jgi:hypothetical protein
MKDHAKKPAPYPKRQTWSSMMMIFVLLWGAALLWHDLGAREVLGKDENATIIKLDQQDLGAVLHANGLKANGQPSSMQPLYFLLQHLAWPLVRHSAFVLRFVPSIFALLSIVFVFKLGETLWSSEVGLVGALLTATLPLHIEYGQIIRPYPLLVLLSLASAFFLVQGLRTHRPINWASFVLTATLNVYTHLNALFVLTAEGIFAAIIWLKTLVALLRLSRGQATSSRDLWLRKLAVPAVCFLLIGLLCIPTAQRLVELGWIGPHSGDAAGEITVQLTTAFFYRYLYQIGLTSVWLRGLILGLMALGMAATVYYRRWQAALLSILWLAIPFLILSTIKSPRPFAERYLIFVPPLALLLAGQGIVALGQGVEKLGQRWTPRRIGQIAIVAISAALALLFLPPLQTYYSGNRASLRLDETVNVLEQRVRPGDIVIVSPRFFVRPLDVNSAEVLYLSEHLSNIQLDEIATQYERIWVLYTSYIVPAELQEPLDRWVQEQEDRFVRVRIKASTTLAYWNRTAGDAEATLLDRADLLQEMAETSKYKQEAWLRYNVLADTYEDLSDLYNKQGKTELALEYKHKADQARSTVSDS